MSMDHCRMKGGEDVNWRMGSIVECLGFGRRLRRRGRLKELN